MLVTAPNMATLVKPDPKNMLSSIVRTPLPIVAVVKLGISEKASTPSEVTEFGIVMELRRFWPNDDEPMLTTLFGIVTDTRDLLAKAPFPMLVTGCPLIVLGISTSRGHAGFAMIFDSLS